MFQEYNRVVTNTHQSIVCVGGVYQFQAPLVKNRPNYTLCDNVISQKVGACYSGQNHIIHK